MTNIPLVVDLDGTIIKTDLLLESANQFLRTHPFGFFKILKWQTQGKCHLKDGLAKNYRIDAKALPYNEGLISWLIAQHKLGRKLILATASHKLLATSIANYLGIFDEVFATEGSTNLKANNKRDILVGKYGPQGFDYVGNDASDLIVWKSARTSHVVSTSQSLINNVRDLGNLGKNFPTGSPSLIKSIIKAFRPYQWLKNLLIFIPLLTAQQFHDPLSNIKILIAFSVFSLMASSAYILNDLCDVENDRYHPRKKSRPFAAGNLSLFIGWLLWPSLMATSFVVSWTLLPQKFVIVLFIYFVLTFTYSWKLKKVVLVDVFTLAGLYTLRIIAGATSILAPISFWLLAFSMFLFLSLAFVKRFCELKSTPKTNQDITLYGRGYQPRDLELVSIMGIASGYIAILVLALYIQDDHTSELYRNPQLIWLACPLLLLWISRAWLISYRGQMLDDPILFALRDWMSWLVGLSFLSVFLLAKYY